MTLEAGTRLGPYEITGRLGAGGMGEVYQASDPRLGRSVAIKVLPMHLATNPDLRQRLEREARAISSLSHPNICALYDIGHERGVDFLVMEHLEGETLGQRLQRGPMVKEEFFTVAIQVADALDKAHRKGIIHRDLKPGNIMLTKEGAKLLDFGLAKAEVTGTAAPGDASSASAPHRTMTEPLTTKGTILGTYQYMSPEQLEGREADARSDLFALGCVLYEMATGRRAFAGETQASLIGSIMQQEPAAVSQIEPMAPPALDRVIQSCLAKDPEERWQTAHDVLLQLRWISEGGSVVGVPAPVSARRRGRERLAWILCGASVLAAVALAVGFVMRAPQPANPVRFQVTGSKEMASMGSPRVSPDGRYLAFNAVTNEGQAMLWLRPLDSLEPRPVSGTEGAGRPFWAPDSRFLAFFAGGKLKKVDVAGAPPQSICDAPTGADGTWGAAGMILYDGRDTDPIMVVPATGGIPKPAVAIEPGHSLGWPEFLPDGEHFLYMKMGQGEDPLLVGSTEEGFEPVELFSAASRVVFAPPDHLIYVREETLVAQRFDPGGFKLLGEPVPLAEEIGVTGIGLAHFSASTNGVLVYRAGETSARRLVWVDAEGRELEEIGEPQEYANTAISPDGKRLVIEISDARSGTTDLWVRDLERRVNSRFTFDPADDGNPFWTPDGRYILFTSEREPRGVYRKDASGAGQPELVFASDDAIGVNSFTPDGRFAALSRRVQTGTGWDVWILPFDGDEAGEPYPFVESRFIEVRPKFSPDGRWLAYDSMESGRIEVYVQPFPGPGGKWQLSTAGGAESWWSADGEALYFLGNDRKLSRVRVETGDALEAGLPESVFDSEAHPAILRNRFVATRGEDRFLILRGMSRESVFPATVVLGWDVGLGE